MLWLAWTETMFEVIVANDLMIKAYRLALPADEDLFREGSRFVKIQWSFRNPLRPLISCRCWTP